MSKKFGCLKYGKEFEVSAPDDIYTEARRKNDKLYDDMLPMKKECFWCKETNEIYWYKPSKSSS